MSEFKIGEICIIQNAQGEGAKFNGDECEIVGELKKRNVRGSIGVGYAIITTDGDRRFAFPHHLRRKQPSADLSAWAKSKVRDLTKQVTA